MRRCHGLSAAGMRFLGTPSVDSSVNSPVPSARRLFRRDGPTVSDDGAAMEQYRRVTPLRGFHPGIPGRRARLDLRGERVGRAAAWGSAADRTVLARGATGLRRHGPRLPGPVTGRPACRHQGDPGRTGRRRRVPCPVRPGSSPLRGRSVAYTRRQLWMLIQDGPVPWLATSYVAGPSLADAVADRGPLPPASVLRLAAGLAEGLDAIHSAGVVHRDLKPSNVLLAEDGPRLIDFGICRSVETRSLTRTGMVVGSPGFMAPEQAEGHEVGPPSDIFSLGAVLTFAATGEGPFGEASSAALLYRVVCAEPNIDGLPAEIRPLIGRCLAKHPQDRPTAAQLLAELSTAQPGARPLPEPAIRGLPGHGPAGPAPDEAARAMAPPRPATERAAPPNLRLRPAPRLRLRRNLPRPYHR